MNRSSPPASPGCSARTAHCPGSDPNPPSPRSAGESGRRRREHVDVADHDHVDGLGLLIVLDLAQRVGLELSTNAGREIYRRPPALTRSTLIAASNSGGFSGANVSGRRRPRDQAGCRQRSERQFRSLLPPHRTPAGKISSCNSEVTASSGLNGCLAPERPRHHELFDAVEDVQLGIGIVFLPDDVVVGGEIDPNTVHSGLMSPLGCGGCIMNGFMPPASWD